MKVWASLLFLTAPLWPQPLPTGLYQVIREDGQRSLMEVGGSVRRALIMNAQGTNSLRIRRRKDQDYDFVLPSGEVLFSSGDNPLSAPPRPRYSFAPIPAQGVMFHEGFVVSGRAFRSLKGLSPLRTDLSALPSRFAFLKNINGTWVELYMDQTALDGNPKDSLPLTAGLLGLITYRALPLDGGEQYWAVLSSFSGGGAGPFTELAIFRKEGALLERFSLLASGDKGFGGMDVKNGMLFYTRHMEKIPPSWTGLYSEALPLALQPAGDGPTLMGTYSYTLGRTPELKELRLTRDLLSPEGGILARGDQIFSGPAPFQRFLRSLLPAALDIKSTENAP